MHEQLKKPLKVDILNEIPLRPNFVLPRCTLLETLIYGFEYTEWIIFRSIIEI